MLGSGTLKEKLIAAINLFRDSGDNAARNTISNIVNGSETGAVVASIDDIVSGNADVFDTIIQCATNETVVRLISDFSGTVRSNMSVDKYMPLLKELSEMEHVTGMVKDQIDGLRGDVCVATDTPRQDEANFFDTLGDYQLSGPVVGSPRPWK